MNLLALAVCANIYVSVGMRVNKQNQVSSLEKWQKGRTFTCLQKWRKHGGGDVDQFCLVDLEMVMDALVNGGKSDEYTMTVPTRWGPCESKRRPYAMRVCDMKGKEDKRVSYSTRTLVPKACFIKYDEDDETFKPDGETSVATFEAAVEASECNQIITDSREGKVGKVGKAQSRGKFVPPPTPEPTPAPTEEPTPDPTEVPTQAPTDEAPIETTSASTSTTTTTMETTTESPTTTTTIPEQKQTINRDLAESSSIRQVDSHEDIDRDEEIKPVKNNEMGGGGGLAEWPPKKKKPLSVKVDKKSATARAFATMGIWGEKNATEAEWCKAFPLKDGCNALRWKVCPVTCKALYQGDKPICHTPIYNPWTQGKACIPVQRKQCPQRCLCIEIDPRQSASRSCSHTLHKMLCPEQCG